MKNVLILGGGFAGIEAAIYLRKYDFDVTLISDREYLYVYPTSIWVPTAEATFEEVTVSLRKLQDVHGFNLVIDEVESIKSTQKRVYCKNSRYDYEYLVIALGSDKVEHKGIENTLSICSKPQESLQIKDSLDLLIKKGSGKICFGFGGNPKDPSNVRGGPIFELLFNVHHKLKKLGIRKNFELTFFAPMKEPGARMGKQALKMMDGYFKRLDIEKITGKKIAEFKEGGILFEDATFTESDLTLFIAAGSGHKVFKNSDLPLNDAGFVRINNYCEVVFDEQKEQNVYAIGDSAALEGPDWRAKQGHIAEVMARNCAFNINSTQKNGSERKGYKEHLNILCVMDSGDGAAFVYRSDKKAMMIPMPLVGHWLKKGWGWYYKNSKLNKIPRLPGL